MSTPLWYSRVAKHPDYNGDRVILIDTNVFSDMALREAWDDELSFVINSPAIELRVKLNQQTLHETLGAGGQSGMSATNYNRQRTFIETYRMNGKILIDDGPVPFFAIDRITIYQALLQAIQATSNVSREDLPIVVDAIVNRIPLLTRERRLPDGLGRALNNGRVKSLVKAYGLWGQPAQILL